MKIGEYKQMNAYLTRPGTPEQKKKAEENNAKYLAERKANTLKKYGLEEAPNNVGEYFQSKEKEKSKGGPDILRNILIEEMKNRNLDSDEIRYLMDTKDRSSYPKEATPEQVGQLAERLERNRQMTGAAPTKLKDLEARYKKPKPIVKKPKEVMPPLEVPTVDMEKLNLISQVPDPETLKLEQKFNEIIRQRQEDDFKNKTTGLAGLLGGRKYV
jgi:hypothetical protein